MKSKPDVDGQGPAGHRRLSRQYIENAKKFLQSGRFEKASEMFWGAVAASVRAVAEARGNSFRTHRGLRDYIRGIARETGREELWRDFKAVEALHVNFYEANEDEASVEELGRIAARLAEAMLSLLQDSVPDDPESDTVVVGK